jgi:hypothetical protein
MIIDYGSYYVIELPLYWLKKLIISAGSFSVPADSTLSYIYGLLMLFTYIALNGILLYASIRFGEVCEKCNCDPLLVFLSLKKPPREVRKELQNLKIVLFMFGLFLFYAL